MINEQLLKDKKILIVDDTPSNVLLMERLLEWAGYSNIKSAGNAETALTMLTSYEPDLIILDLHMPGVDGFELMRRMRQLQDQESFLPILVFTADTSPEARKNALALGATDFLTKPGEATEVAIRVRNFLHARHMNRELRDRNRALEQKVAERVRDLWSSQVEVLERLAKAAELRDDDAADHAKRVGEISAKIARILKWENGQIEVLRLAAPLHDVGKVGVADGLLAKRGKLTEEEHQELRVHTTIGGELLSGGRTPLIQMAEAIARNHHERWNGSGYPAGLAGEAIPWVARIVAVADTFDSSMIARPYRKALSVEEAMAEIVMASGELFDPAVVAAFVEAFKTSADRDALAMVA